jgi:polygalacturonase
MNNTNAFNLALTEARSGDIVLVPDGRSFVMFGSVLANNKHNIAIDIAGSAHFVHNRNIWPYGTVPRSSSFSKNSFDPGITVYNCTSIILTSSSVKRARVQVDYKKNGVYLVNAKEYSGGILNGNGKGWWDDVISGRLPAKQGDSRPRLVLIMESEDVLVENLTLVNSPFWSLTVEAVKAEVRHVNVLVDRKYQAALFERVSTTVEYDRALEGLDFPFPIDDLPDWIGRKLHQPQDLNTDGIDPKGKNIWIHDCIIQNADDSVAVKPLYSGRDINSRIPDCTRNITVENMVMTGFGASIGSVHPRNAHSCIDDVTFRNISMPGTGKGKGQKQASAFAIRTSHSLLDVHFVRDLHQI